MSSQSDEVLSKKSNYTTEEESKDAVPLAWAASSGGEEEQEQVSKHPEQDSSLSFAWRMLLGTIRKTFPKAKQLKTRLLNDWMADEERSKHLMLFVRIMEIFRIFEHFLFVFVTYTLSLAQSLMDVISWWLN